VRSKADKLDSLRKPIVIDVRSPCEFAAERILARSIIPLLNDVERATIGTIYAAQAEVMARRQDYPLYRPEFRVSSTAFSP